MRSSMLATHLLVRDAPAPAILTDRHVLVVEDHPVVRTLIQRVLEMEGLVVETAEDGFQGLSRARTRRPALVILDLNLPALDGETVARELWATYGQTLKVVFVSADDEVQGVARRIGADGWSAKPFTVAELRGAVQQAFGSPVIH